MARLSVPRDNGALLGKHLKLARKLQNLKERHRDSTGSWLETSGGNR